MVLESAGGFVETVIYDLERGAWTRLTSEGSNQAPIWTPDGDHVVYRSTRAGYRNLSWKRADGNGPEERLTNSEYMHTPYSWSGMVLAFGVAHPDTGDDIWLLPFEGDRKPVPFLNSRFTEALPQFSPDGRWLAYT